jgi:hypothetical protein
VGTELTITTEESAESHIAITSIPSTTETTKQLTLVSPQEIRNPGAPSPTIFVEQREMDVAGLGSIRLKGLFILISETTKPIGEDSDRGESAAGAAGSAADTNSDSTNTRAKHDS